MVASNFEASLARVLKHEGGYANHPSDPGGITNFGITIATYARFKGGSVTAAQMRAMPLSDAKAIYKADYWNTLRCDELPIGLDYALFDYGVNSGSGRASKVLHRLLGLAASAAVTDEAILRVGRRKTTTLVSKLCNERLTFLQSLKTWPVFGKGWERRVAEVRRDALAMADGTISPIAPSSTRTVTKAATIGAAGVGAGQVAHIAGAPLSTILTLVIVSCGLAAAGWAGWAIWHRYKQEAQKTAVSKS